jgi:hypothetical protein
MSSISFKSLDVIDALARLVGMERIVRMVLMLLSLVLIKPMFMRSVLSDLYLVKTIGIHK